jgi:hypothetical protein
MDAYGGLLEKSGIVIPETARQSEKKLLEFMRAEVNVH